MTKKRSKARVYINRVLVLSIVSACLYGAYQGYEYLKPTAIATVQDHTTAQGKELEAIMNSEAFKAKAQNLAEQQLLVSKIEAKKDSIEAMQKEIAVLQSELETKRNASLSL